MPLHAFEHSLQSLNQNDPLEVLRWASRTFGDGIVLASALGPEAQVLTHLIGSHDIDIPIVTIDTGRLFQETFDLIEATERICNVTIRVLFPERKDVEDLIHASGPNGFRTSIKDRLACCEVRKVRPLKRVLATKQAWMTGLRAAQSPTRKNAALIEWDGTHRLTKINPLVDWTDARLWDYIRDHRVPTNRLHQMGYPSIGCASCTRAVAAGEDKRSGRWWWEDPQFKECGLHGRPVVPVHV